MPWISSLRASEDSTRCSSLRPVSARSGRTPPSLRTTVIECCATSNARSTSSGRPTLRPIASGSTRRCRSRPSCCLVSRIRAYRSVDPGLRQALLAHRPYQRLDGDLRVRRQTGPCPLRLARPSPRLAGPRGAHAHISMASVTIRPGSPSPAQPARWPSARTASRALPTGRAPALRCAQHHESTPAFIAARNGNSSTGRDGLRSASIVASWRWLSTAVSRGRGSA